jgi:hypothetical protein
MGGSMPTSSSAVHASGRDCLCRAGVVLVLGGCAGVVGIDLYHKAQTERALAEIQKAGEIYLREEGRGRPVVSIDLGATLEDDSGRVHRRGHVTDDVLPLLRGFGQLRDLSLDGADVTDAGLVSLRGLKELRKLNLSRTRLTDAGLGPLQEMGGLRVIDLRGTRVTPEGVSDLRRALPMAEVRADEPDGAG